MSIVCHHYRTGVGAPVVSECDGDYHHDSRRSVLEWSLPVIDESNKSGSMEFSISGMPDDFFPVTVSFISKKLYCDIQVSTCLPSSKMRTVYRTFYSTTVFEIARHRYINKMVLRFLLCINF